MKYIILLLLFINFIQAEDAKQVPQPIEVQRALAEFEKGAVNARKVYDTETTKLAGKALEQLEKAKLSYMQKGDLEGANLVSSAIKKLNEGEILMAIEENIKTKMDIIPNETNQIVGKWQGNGSWWHEYMADGTFKDCGRVAGKWLIKGNKFIVTFDNGTVDTFNLPIKNNRLSGSDNKGSSYTITKVVAK
jgi:hypothetical protein